MKITKESIFTLLAGTVPTKVDLKLPKFAQRLSPDMERVFAARGLGVLFNRYRADLSGINGITEGDDKLHVGSVNHEAVVKMYEEGTTAAAASGIGVVGTTSMPFHEEAVTFFATRPFLFFVVHKPSNAILFLGRVAEPSFE